jgi:DNA polymerase epsilon subunit 2
VHHFRRFGANWQLQFGMERSIFKRFKEKGLTISNDALKGVVSQLGVENDPDAALTDILDAIKERKDKNELESAVITYDVMASVVAEMTMSEDDMKDLHLFRVVDAFKGPRISYDEGQKTYSIESSAKYSLYPGIESRARMFRERFHMVQQRLLRKTNYKLRGLSSENKRDSEEVSTIESLLGDPGHRVLLGIITQPEEGKWFLEDITSNIWLDLSIFSKTVEGQDRIFTEGSIVVCSGSLSIRDTNRFVVDEMMLVPAESRKDSLYAMGIVDPFGTNERESKMNELRVIEQRATQDIVIVASEVSLASNKVCENLKKLFNGFEQMPMIASREQRALFVLIGPFTSKDFTSTGGREEAELAFSNLGGCLSDCPVLREEAKFLLVPGPSDPGAKNAWPRRNIPEYLISGLRKKIKNLSLASNPCRVKFYTQEIVIFRDDLLRRMMRHVVIAPNRAENSLDLNEQLVQTLCDQAHLFPLPSTAKPVHWELDHAMRLTPLPDLLILADKTEQFKHEYEGCLAVNPGSFAVDASFLFYVPATKDAQFSRIDK